MPIDSTAGSGYTIYKLVMIGGDGMILGHADILPGQTGHDAGRALLKKLYETHIGQPIPKILTADRGKPYFAQGSWHFSISHTKHHVFCALSENPVGIDAEETDRPIRLDLADKILSPSEKQQFAAAADQRLALLTFWVLKEAAAKLTGEGLLGYPEKGDFRLDDPRVKTINGCLVAVMK